MASYFVALPSAAGGPPEVHDRTRCPPGRFPRAGSEYLGEYFDPAQALAVARLRYADVTRCACCGLPVAASVQATPALSALRS